MRTKLFTTLAAAATLATIVTTVGTANAATLSYSAQYRPTDGTVTDDDYYFTDIKDTISVKKFDTTLGTLKSVKIDFTGNLKGNAGFESLDNQASTVTLNFAGLLKLQLPENVDRFQLTPQQSYTYNVTKRDGRLDYAGTAGRTVGGLTAGISETKTLTEDSFEGYNFLDYFLGKGNVDFTLVALGTSAITGSANIASYVETYANASINVTYDYDPVQSVPESSAAMGIGLVAGLGLLSQRKKSLLKTSS